MRAGNRDALVLADEGRIDVRAVQLRDTEVLGRQDFRIVERDGRRDDDGVDAADILRLLAAQRNLRPIWRSFSMMPESSRSEPDTS